MRAALEVADIVRAHGDEFRRKHAQLCPPARSACYVPSNGAAPQLSAVILSDAIDVATNATPIIRALWGVFSNGEWPTKGHAARGLTPFRLSIMACPSAVRVVCRAAGTFPCEGSAAQLLQWPPAFR